MTDKEPKLTIVSEPTDSLWTPNDDNEMFLDKKSSNQLTMFLLFLLIAAIAIAIAVAIYYICRSFNSQTFLSSSTSLSPPTSPTTSI